MSNWIQTRCPVTNINLDIMDAAFARMGVYADFSGKEIVNNYYYVEKCDAVLLMLINPGYASSVNESQIKEELTADLVGDFLFNDESSLATGLDLPFPILSSVFKGIRKINSNKNQNRRQLF